MAGLTVTRYPNESIHVGDDIVVTLRRSWLGRARINIVAPKGVLIMRSELRDTTQQATPEVADGEQAVPACDREV